VKNLIGSPPFSRVIDSRHSIPKGKAVEEASMSIKRLQPTSASVTSCADAQAAPVTLAGEAHVIYTGTVHEHKTDKSDRFRADHYCHRMGLGAVECMLVHGHSWAYSF